MRLAFFLLFFLFSIFSYSQLPNDCEYYIVTCGDSGVNLDIESGPGLVNEVNSCSSGENNSIWFKLNIANTGNLGFTLTPESTNIVEDYDFFVFGPNVTCDNLGSTIRCSTTSPQAAGSSSNLTGMNSTETDTSEGPSAAGNNFVQWLTVTAGESYFLVIDRAAGNSAFSIEWSTDTGNTAFYESPIGDDLQVNLCPDLTGNAAYNLRTNEINLIDGQDVSVTYHNTISDAQIGIDSIVIPEDYTTAIDSTVYVRMENNTTECFSVFKIDLTIGFEINTPDTLYECGIANTTFNFSEQSDLLIGNNNNTVVSYYISESLADTSTNPIGDTYENISNPQQIWYRLDNTDNGCSFVNSFALSVESFFTNAEPNFLDAEPVLYCKNDYPNTIELAIDLENNDIDDYTYLWHTGETSSSIFVNKENDYTVTITNQFDCEITKTFQVFSSDVFPVEEPTFLNQTLYYCTNTYPNTITLNSGVIENDINSYTFLWTTTETTESIETNEIGEYQIVVYNSDGCNLDRTLTVLPSSMPIIKKVLMTDTSNPERINLITETAGEGDYIYAIDIEDESIEDETKFSSENYFKGVLYGWHTITVKDKNGCGYTQKEIFLLKHPKFLTPNNDGYYDTWNIDNKAAVNNTYNINSEITIYDRFGKIMAVITSDGNGWDGTYKGLLMPSDDYWFRLTLNNYNGKKIIKKGHFSLKR